jgi:hypothetical protein
MGTTGASTPIRGIRNLYGPARPPVWLAVGLGDTLVTPADEVVADVDLGETYADAVIAGVGAGVGPGAVTSWSPALQAAVTARRASPAMNRAGARGTRLAGLEVGSGFMQEAAARNQRRSCHRTTGGKHQTEEPG